MEGEQSSKLHDLLLPTAHKAGKTDFKLPTDSSICLSVDLSVCLSILDLYLKRKGFTLPKRLLIPPPPGVTGNRDDRMIEWGQK